jgi:hypothetical protein
LTPVRRAVRVRGMIFLRADGIGILLGWGSIQLWRVSRGRERGDNIAFDLHHCFFPRK